VRRHGEIARGAISGSTCLMTESVDMAPRVRGNLAYLERRGKVGKRVRDEGVRWALGVGLNAKERGASLRRTGAPRFLCQIGCGVAIWRRDNGCPCNLFPEPGYSLELLPARWTALVNFPSEKKGGNQTRGRGLQHSWRGSGEKCNPMQCSTRSIGWIARRKRDSSPTR